ncbi:hypothetical protein JYU12_00600 [bacterium AH-315-K03]|nr:hypothetical protein [bacterium AH-315-K03]
MDMVTSSLTIASLLVYCFSGVTFMKKKSFAIVNALEIPDQPKKTLQLRYTLKIVYYTLFFMGGFVLFSTLTAFLTISSVERKLANPVLKIVVAKEVFDQIGEKQTKNLLSKIVKKQSEEKYEIFAVSVYDAVLKPLIYLLYGFLAALFIFTLMFSTVLWLLSLFFIKDDEEEVIYNG